MAGTAPKTTLDSHHDVARRAYGTKLESLRRRQLEQLFQIHGIKHGDLIKDDLVTLGQGYEAMGYDLWKRPEEQPPPKFSWPGAAPQPAPSPNGNVEGSGKGRTTSDTLQAPQAPEAPAVPPADPVESTIPSEDVAADEWDEIKSLTMPELRKLTKAVGLSQTNTSNRRDLTTNIMAHIERFRVAKWIAENVANKDAA